MLGIIVANSSFVGVPGRVYNLVSHSYPYSNSLTMARFARQVDYDHMVKEMLSQGASVEDAVQEVDETFVEGGYDLNSLFRYRNDEDMKQKVKVEGYLRMFEQLLVSHDASVNLVFGIQGLTQNLQSRGNETLRVGTLRLIEQKSTFSTILRVLAAMAAASNDEEIEDRSNGEDSDEDEDEDENKILQKLHILTFASIIAQYPREEYVDYETLLCLSEETAPLLKTAIDADCGEAR